MSDLSPEYQKVVNLLGTAKTLSGALNNAMKEEKNLEDGFLKKNKGKTIVLMTDKGELSGELEDINRFRIELKTKEGIRYFCKTGLIGFYANTAEG